MEDNELDDGLQEQNEEVEAAQEILPSWFVGRMMTDEWTFGLLLVTGDVLVISSISAVHQSGNGAVWLDVNMCEKGQQFEPELGEQPSNLKYFLAPTPRTTASINAAHIVAAFELAST